MPSSLFNLGCYCKIQSILCSTFATNQGGGVAPNSYKIFRLYAHVPHSCTENMHLQSSLHAVPVLVCVYDSIRRPNGVYVCLGRNLLQSCINRSQDTNCGVDVYWYKLRLCKTLALKWGGGGRKGVYSGVGVYSEFYGSSGLVLLCLTLSRAKFRQMRLSTSMFRLPLVFQKLQKLSSG